MSDYSEESMIVVDISTLQGYLSVLRKRPGMYLGEKSITKLFDHCNGYCAGNSKGCGYFENIHWYVNAFVGASSGHNYCTALLESEHDEARAFDKLFEILDQRDAGYDPFTSRIFCQELRERFLELALDYSNRCDAGEVAQIKEWMDHLPEYDDTGSWFYDQMKKEAETDLAANGLYQRIVLEIQPKVEHRVKNER